MNIRPLLASLAVLAFSLPAFAADNPAAGKPAYTVLLEITVDEKGVPVDAVVVTSDDTTIDHILEREALNRAKELKLPPRVKDGHAVKYTVRAPYLFPVEGDQGPEANNVPKPRITSAPQPIYPADLAAKGDVGGVILELTVGVDGKASDLKVIRSSNPAFAQAASAGVGKWTFVPAQRDGQPVASHWHMSICFETDARATDWNWRLAPRPSLGNYTVIHRILPAEPPAAAPQAAPAKEPGK